MSEIDRTPDSQAVGSLSIEVYDTPEYDNPMHGSVTVRIQKTEYSTQTIRMTLGDAAELAHYLYKYLESK